MSEDAMPGLAPDDRAWCSNREVAELRGRAEKAESRVAELEADVDRLDRLLRDRWLNGEPTASVGEHLKCDAPCSLECDLVNREARSETARPEGLASAAWLLDWAADEMSSRGRREGDRQDLLEKIQEWVEGYERRWGKTSPTGGTER